MKMMMDGLTTGSSSSKIAIDRYSLTLAGGGGKDYMERRFQPLISFSKCSTRFHLTSLKCQTVLPTLPPISATSYSHSQTSETAVDGEGQLSTVRVRFQLQKACAFGDHFLIVGDDPLFGSWDPESAITMEWSNGHKWTAEVDVPVEKTIQFKFILKQSIGDIVWQPGPDRVFKAWTTTNNVNVIEDWENSEMQKVLEDGVPGYDVEENIIFPNDSTLKNSKIVASVVEENSYAGKESSISTMVAHNIVSDHRRSSSTEGLEDEEVILSNPVLVPGLAPPMPTMSTDESLLANKDKNTDLNGSVSSQDSNDQTALESCSNSKAESEVFKHLLKEETKPNAFSREENLKGESEENQTAAVMPNREQRNKMKLSVELEFDNPYLREVESRRDTAIPIHDVLKKDMHWSRKTLQNLLATLWFFLISVIRSIYD